MKKIKIVHHSKTVGFAGTDRTAQLFCKYLAKSDKYEPYIIYREGPHENSRLEIAKEWLGEDHVVPYQWEPGKATKLSPYMPKSDNIYDVLKVIDPQIFHLHRSGYAEHPGFKYLCPTAKFIETNIFGYNDHTSPRSIDRTVYISDFIRNSAMNAGNEDGPVIYNPIEQPHFDVMPDVKKRLHDKLCDQVSIPHESIIMGRVGRADNFDPISLNAMVEIETHYNNVHYLVVNACNRWRETVAKLNLTHVHFLDAIIDDEKLSEFYMGLDIYAHARQDGECCPCNIQEAMMHGVPVVSHESAIYNGQSEIVGECGFVVPIGDSAAYAKCLDFLIADKDVTSIIDNANQNPATGMANARYHYGREGRRRAMRYFEADYATNQLIKVYDYVLQETKVCDPNVSL